MAFIIEQEAKGRIYVYKVVSYWDKDKKQPRQKREYLGRKDPITGEIIRTSKKGVKKFVKALDFGNTFFLQEIAKAIGLTDVLKEAFPYRYKDILTLVEFKVSEDSPLYLASYWAESSYVLSRSKDIVSQRISELLEDIGRAVGNRQRFFREWSMKVGEVKVIYFDITSISTYSRLLDLAEWGYNRDKEHLPQVNLGLICGGESGLPLYYNIYQGSIPDVRTLDNILEYNKIFGIKDVIFIMDRGFYSKKNIEKLKDKKVIIPLTFSTKISRDLINKADKRLNNERDMFMFGGDLYNYIKERVEISGVKLNAHIYRNKSRYYGESMKFHKALLGIEEDINKGEYTSKEEIIEAIEEGYKGYSRYYTIISKGGKYSLKRDIKEIKEKIKRFGTFILLTNEKGLKKEDVIGLHRNRNMIERLFGIMKNEANGDRLRVNTREKVEGSLFITYLSSILLSYIENKIRFDEVLKGYTKREIIYELKKLKMIRYENGLNILTEVSKRAKDIFKAFNIEVPGEKT